MTDKKKIKKKEKYIREVVLPSGSHVLRIEVRLNGQSFRKSVEMKDFKSASEAMNAAVKIRDDILNKIRAGAVVGNFSDIKHLYEQSYEILPVSLKTRRRHDIYFRQCFIPFQDTPIDRITAADIQICLNKYAETHTRQETGKMLAVWRRIYKTAAMMEMNVSDKTLSVMLPKGIQPTHRKKEIDPEDLEAFCTALLKYNQASVSGSYNCTAIYYGIRIMQHCGLRPAEAFALSRSDIDLNKKTILISKAAHSTKDSLLEISTTKTEGSARTVPVPDQLLPVLREALQWSQNDILLADYYGQLMGIDWIDTLIRNVRIKCGIDFTLYQLRHQFSSDLLSSGVPVHTVRDLMGHRSSSMSLDYAVSTPEDRQKAVNKRYENKKDAENQ